MSLSVRCPNPACGRTGNVPATLVNRPGRCPQCGTRFVLTTAPPGPAEGTIGSGDTHGAPPGVGPDALPASPAAVRPHIMEG